MESKLGLSELLSDLCDRFMGYFSPAWTGLAAWLSPVLGRLVCAWSLIWNPLRVPWLCSFDAVAAILVAYLFILNDQGQDLLRISAESGWSWSNLSFLVGAAALSLTLWYTARLLLGRRFENYPLELSQARWLQVWMPRAFGIVVPLSIAIGLARIGSKEQQLAAWTLCLLYALLTAWVAWFFRARRKLFKVAADALIEKRVKELARCDLVLMWGGGILSFLLLGAVMLWPVGLPQFMGAPAVILFGLAGIALFGSMVLTHAFLAHGQPAGTAPVLVLAVVFGLWNDNHWVRMADDVVGADLAAIADARPSPSEHFSAWRAAHGSFNPVDGREPLILVAASGGGIRAAYWTASTLAALDRIPGFSDNLFAISAVSGGSLGAATYVATKRGQLANGKPEDLLGAARRILKEDFLSPVVAGMLFPDLLQRFLPFPMAAADRQRFLEMSWEKALGDNSNAFSAPFVALYEQGFATRLPSLLLNATVVDSGRRAIVSNMKTGTFTDSVDLLAHGFSTRGVSLSAAAGMSARFAYVSPPGSLWRPHGTGEEAEAVKMRVVDGGYFENSGAVTLMDLLSVLGRTNQNLFPILILIRNDPQAPFVCNRSEGATPLSLAEGTQRPLSKDFLSEVGTPFRSLLNTRSARGRLAEVDAARAVEQLGGAVIEISLADALQQGSESQDTDPERVIEPPLGWSLSEAVRKEMDKALEYENGGPQWEMKKLAILLSSGEFDPSRDGCHAR